MKSWTLVSAISLPAPDDDQVVGGLGHLAHQVRGHEHRPALGGQRLQQVADPADAVGIQAVDRLVQDDGLRVAEQRRGDAEPLAHAEGEAARPASGPPRPGRPGRPPRRPGAGRCRAVCARASRWLNALRPVWTDRASSRAPTSCSGAVCSRYALPFTRTVPAVGASRPRIIRIVVDLPAPLGPRNPVTTPGSHGERQVVDGSLVRRTLGETRGLDHGHLFRSTGAVGASLVGHPTERRCAPAAPGTRPGEGCPPFLWET